MYIDQILSYTLYSNTDVLNGSASCYRDGVHRGVGNFQLEATNVVAPPTFVGLVTGVWAAVLSKTISGVFNVRPDATSFGTWNTPKL